jgi:hypothetical protein
MSIMSTMKQKMQYIRREPTLRVKKATLYAIIDDIEALHERVHEVAYARFERPSHPIPAMSIDPPPDWTTRGPGGAQWERPDCPSSPPSPKHLTPWYAPARPEPSGLSDLPTRYSSMHPMGGQGPMGPSMPTYPYADLDSRSRSPVAGSPVDHFVRYRKGGPSSGPHGTPNEKEKEE